MRPQPETQRICGGKNENLPIAKGYYFRFLEMARLPMRGGSGDGVEARGGGAGGTFEMRRARRLARGREEEMADDGEGGEEGCISMEDDKGGR